MTAIEQRGSELPDNLPVLTQIVGDELPDDLPMLTEVAGYEGPDESVTGFQSDISQEVFAPETVIPASYVPNEEEMQRLLQQLETHLETVFTQKLSRHLEHLQKQAVEQAINELKAELPELLHNALSSHPGL